MGCKYFATLFLNFALFLFYFYFIYIIICFILLTVISENCQIISIITDYECVTCHRVFQSEDVSHNFVYFLNYVLYTRFLFSFFIDFMTDVERTFGHVSRGR